jgi:hypothetical protein
VPEIGTLGLMSGGGKRSAGHRPQATAPTPDSTDAEVLAGATTSAAILGTRDVVDLTRICGRTAPVAHRNPMWRATRRAEKLARAETPRKSSPCNRLLWQPRLAQPIEEVLSVLW